MTKIVNYNKHDDIQGIPQKDVWTYKVNNCSTVIVIQTIIYKKLTLLNYKYKKFNKKYNAIYTIHNQYEIKKSKHSNIYKLKKFELSKSIRL